LRKGLVSYFKNNGIIALKKHVNVEHGLIAQISEKEMNIMKSLIKNNLEKKGHRYFHGELGPTCSQKSFADSIC
jgi:hypothetical protein